MDVLPVPVSPTSNTGSFQATQHATRSNKQAAGRVNEKLDPLTTLNKRNVCNSSSAIVFCTKVFNGTESNI